MVIGSRLGAQEAGLAAAHSDTRAAAGHIALEPFDYSGVTLGDSRWRTQYLAAREFYLNVQRKELSLQ